MGLELIGEAEQTNVGLFEVWTNAGCCKASDAKVGSADVIPAWRNKDLIAYVVVIEQTS